MWLHRVLFRVMFPAALLLPLLLLIVRGTVFVGSAGDVVLLLVLSPVLVLLLGAVAFLMWSRKVVRSARAVTTPDAVVLIALYVVVVSAAVVEHPSIALLVAVVGVAAFWFAAWRLFTETRRRVRSAFEGFEFTAVSAEEYRMRQDAGSPSPEAPLAGQVIRLDPPSGGMGDR